jgi:hypothetical protein
VLTAEPFIRCFGYVKGHVKTAFRTKHLTGRRATFLEDAMDIEEKAKELVALEIEKRKLELQAEIESLKFNIILEQKKKELELLMMKGEIKRFRNE